MCRLTLIQQLVERKKIRGKTHVSAFGVQECVYIRLLSKRCGQDRQRQTLVQMKQQCEKLKAPCFMRDSIGYIEI